MAAAPTLRDIYERQGRYYESIVAAFDERLREIVSGAQARTLGYLNRELTFEGDLIGQSPANLRVLRRLDRVFLNAMEELGYQSLLDAYVSQFPNQLPFFQETLDVINRGLKTPLPTVNFTARDLRMFESQQISTIGILESATEKAAQAARRQALFSIGGLGFESLTMELSRQFSKGLSESSGLAATGVSTFYRMVTDRGFQQIEAELPQQKLRYKYEGPLDRITRPFCARLLRAGKSYTREQIASMSNGQIPNVFASAGGFLCRHQWMIAVEDEQLVTDPEPPRVIEMPAQPQLQPAVKGLIR